MTFISRISPQLRGNLAFVGSALCIGSLAVVTKLGYQQALPMLAMLISRAAFGGLMVALLLICTGRGQFAIDRRGLQRCFIVALFNCASWTAYFLTLSHLDVSLSLIVYTASYIPLVILINRYWGQAAHPIDWIRFGLALGGVYLFVQPSGVLNLIGIGMAILNAIFYGSFTVMIERRLGDYPPMTVLVYILLFMSLILLAFGLGVGVTWPARDNLAGWSVLLWLGLISTGLARVFLFTGIKLVGSKQAALFSPLDMILSILLAIIFLNEQVIGIQIVGALLIVVSVLLANWRASKRPFSPDPSR